MRSLFTAVSIASVIALTGCSTLPATDPGDQQACTIWSEAEQAMIQTVAIIVELAKDPAAMTEEVVGEFNTKRNQLLEAYDKAKEVASSPDLKAALEAGIDKDSIVYYDLAGATNERIQESMAAVSTIVATCAVAGVDVSGVLGTK